MSFYRRIFVIVLDSLGIGEMPDATMYGDGGANTLGHLAAYRNSKGNPLSIEQLRSLGIANLIPLEGVSPHGKPLGYYGSMRELSAGKDTMTGHWEMMGLPTFVPFRTFPHGFPDELIHELERRTGRTIVGNKSASGTEILEELGEEEVQKGRLIVYTSADSVLQICGNEELMGRKTLYHYCQIARELTMKEEWRVGRVIARPYTGKRRGEFQRTSARHDYAIAPGGRTVLDALKDAGYEVLSIGKIQDIFSGQGITKAYPSKSSIHGMEQTIEAAKTDFSGLCFTNLVDFDALWGHRRNSEGYACELEAFDRMLAKLMNVLCRDDLLILTADHGNDPTHTGTDHTREKVPFLAWSPSMKGQGRLEESPDFARIGATIAENFELPMPEGTIGVSCLEALQSS